MEKIELVQMLSGFELAMEKKHPDQQQLIREMCTVLDKALGLDCIEADGSAEKVMEWEQRFQSMEYDANAKSCTGQITIG